MLNFTVGPVQSPDYVLEIGSEQVPYFRTPEFSSIMLENEQLMLKFAQAPQGSRAVFMTGSGTASMESCMMNLFNDDDKLLIINGGSFGARFCELAEVYGLNHTVIKLAAGKTLNIQTLNQYDQKGYTALVVNIHETSTGVHYDLNMLSEFCNRNGMFLLVDAISSFLADELNMEAQHIGAMITGSQKALACPPGISIIVLSPAALARIEANPRRCVYLDLKSALSNGVRGQTPFTPAVGVLRQINARLKFIADHGGVNAEIARVKALAEDFRKKITGLPLEVSSECMSNAVTPLHPCNVSAYEVFKILKDEYGIWICPNGGELADKVFRVGHIGALTPADNDTLVNAFNDLVKRGLL